MEEKLVRRHQLSQKSWAVILALVSLIAVLFWSFRPTDRNWSPSVIFRTQVQAEEMIRVLDQCKLDTGHYPKALDELVPSYVSHIDSPEGGDHEWRYNCSSDGTYFNLWFQGGKRGHEAYSISAKRRTWSYDDGEF